MRVFLSPPLFVCPFSGAGAAGAVAAGCRFSAGDVSSFYFSMCGLFGGGLGFIQSRGVVFDFFVL